MIEKPVQALRNLITSFEAAFSPDQIADLRSWVDHGEWTLAFEILCDWIYEEDIPVSPEQEAEFLQSCRDLKASRRLAFIGRQHPYPDLRTPEQLEAELRHQTPSIENVAHFAKAGH